MYYNNWNNYQCKYKFTDYSKVKETFSQCWQDIFVLSVLNGKYNGTYLEIGAAYPEYTNNTYLLKKYFNWSGVSIDFSDYMRDQWIQNRPEDKFVYDDALIIDYQQLLSNNYNSKNIDYLQLDIDPSDKTLAALKRIPLDEYRFSVITFETDLYVGGPGPGVREESRKILSDYGYTLIIGDVLESGQHPFEDWWVDLNLVNEDIALSIKDSASTNQNPFDLLIDQN